MMKRSGRFYRKNEVEVMEHLGLKPTKNSGSGWIEKEDGQSEEIICQLKSTDAQSIKLNKKDLDTLIYNAATTHKLPLFVIQFLQSNESYLIIKPEMVCDIAKYIEYGEYTDLNTFVGIDIDEHDELSTKDDIKVIKSNENAREKFRKENDMKFKKKTRRAK